MTGRDGHEGGALLLVTAVVTMVAGLGLTLASVVVADDAAAAPEPAPAPAPVELLVVQATPSPTLDPDAPEDVAEQTFEIYSARDPFEQLVQPPSDPGGDGGDATADTTPSTSTPSFGSPTGGSATPAPTGSPRAGATADPTPHATATPTATPTPTPTGLAAREVELVDTLTRDGEPRALIAVNGRGYEVAEGQTFAHDFRLVSLDPPCATLTYTGQRFLLCKGDKIRK